MLDTTKPVLIITCGAPGSGKSTYYREGLKNGSIPPQSIRINMDDIRAEVTGNQADQSKNNVVYRIAEAKLRASLSERIPVIYWDNTSSKARVRKPLIQLAKEAGYNVLGVYWELPLDVCLSRNRNRQFVVPEEFITHMHENFKLNPPRKEEGFDDIIVINN